MSFDRRQFFNEFIDDFFAESEEHLANIRKQLLALEEGRSGDGLAALFEELLRSFHTLKGLSSMVGCGEIEQVSHYTEEYIRQLRSAGLPASAEGTEALIQVAEVLEQAVAAVRTNQPLPDVTSIVMRLSDLAATKQAAASPSIVSEIPAEHSRWRFRFRPAAELAEKGINVGAVRDRLQAIGRVIRVAPHVGSQGEVFFEFIVSTSADEETFPETVGEGVDWTRAEDDRPEKSITRAPATRSQEDQGQVQTIVRVEMNRLDELMRIVGELMTHRWRLDERLKPFESRMSHSDWRSVQETTTGIERELRSLREAVMRVRMVPIGQIFERMRFVVYTLEREIDTKIRLELAGEDTEVDKLVVEKIMEPLLHIVRNAISHGLEGRAERIAAGKPAEGTIRLMASTVADDVVIDIYDDGRGIDPEVVTQRGRSLGVLGADESVTPTTLLRVLCSPGFSTREKADLASGRGVGMAVVQRAVSELGGVLSLQSAKGQGSHFNIKLPLTLAIADAFIVAVGQERFAMPQNTVEEVMRVESGNVVRAGNGELIPYRGVTLPFIRLSEVFGLPPNRKDAFHVLVVNRNGDAVGVAVDRVLYHREVVIRSMTDPLMRVPGFSGATEVGDGKPILIIDPTALIREVLTKSARSA